MGSDLLDYQGTLQYYQLNMNDKAPVTGPEKVGYHFSTTKIIKPNLITLIVILNIELFIIVTSQVGGNKRLGRLCHIGIHLIG